MALFGKQFIKQKSLATNKIKEEKAITFLFRKRVKITKIIRSICNFARKSISMKNYVETLICRVTAEVEVAGGLQAEVSAVPFPPKLLICKQW